MSFTKLASAIWSDASNVPKSEIRIWGAEVEALLTQEAVETEADLIAAFAAGGSYILTEDISVTTEAVFVGSDTKHLFLDMNGKTITSDNAGNSVFDLSNTAKESPVSITAIATDERDLSGGSGNLTTCSVLTCSGHACVAGDLVKVFDDTLLPQQHVEKERQGEFAVVHSITATQVILRGALLETYNTGANAKIVRPSKSRVSISNGVLLSDSATMGASGLVARGFIGPRVEGLTMEGFKGPGVKIAGGFVPLVNDCTYENGDLTAFSYGFEDVCCHGAIFDNVRGVGGRHLFTTNVGSTEAGDDNWFERGRNYYPIVSNSRGMGFAGTFDTHPSAVWPSFENCRSVGSFRGQDSGGAGFQIRGPSATIEGCKSHNGRYGMSLQRDADETLPSSIVVRNFLSDGDESSVQVVGEAGNGVINVDFEGCTFDGFEAEVFVQPEFAQVRLDGPTFRLRDNAVTTAEIFDLKNDVEIVAKAASFDVTDAPNADSRLGQARGANCSLLGDFEIIQGGADKLSNYFDAGSEDVVVALTIEKDSKDSKVVSNQGAGSSVQLIEKRNEGVDTEASTYLQRNITVTGNQTLDLSDAGDEHIFVRAYVTVAGAVINAMHDGKFIGQRVTIFNRDNSTSSLSFYPATMAGPAIGLAALASATVFWNGQQWYPVS